MRIREIAAARGRYGDRKIQVLLKHEGWKVGKKLVYRLYREEGLTLLYTSSYGGDGQWLRFFLTLGQTCATSCFQFGTDLFLAFAVIGQ